MTRRPKCGGQELIGQLADLVVAGLPEVGQERAQEIVVTLGGNTRRFLRAHLLDHPDALTSGDSLAPPSMQRFITQLRDAGFTRARQPACPRCGRHRPLVDRADDGHVCRGCAGAEHYRSTTGVCACCGRQAIPLPAMGLCSACYRRTAAPKSVCAGCGRLRSCSSAQGKPLCDECRPRPKQDCALCGQQRAIRARWPLGPVCRRCYEHTRASPAPCPRCGRTDALIGRVDDQPCCGPCAGSRTDYRCTRCNTSSPGRSTTRRRCSRCALDDELEQFFARLPPAAAGQLAPLRTALATTSRHGTALNWLRGSTSSRLLSEMAASHGTVTHHLLDTADPDTRWPDYLRKLLTVTGVLPERDEHLAVVERHLERAIGRHPKFAAMLRAYGRWALLPRLRRRGRARPSTQYVAAWAITRVNCAIAFLTWADRNGLTLSDVHQEHVDQWLTSGTSTRYNVRDFVVWAVGRGLARNLTVPHRGKPDPTGMDDNAHWDLLQQCYYDDDLPLDVRVAGALILLYGQHTSRIARLTAGHIQQRGERTYLTLDQTPVILPPPLALLVELLAEAPRTAVVQQPDQPRWLFPSSHPGRHNNPNTLGQRLNAHGIFVRLGRATALINLAQDLPTPVLADITGMHNTTAHDWHRRAAPDWSAYLAARRKAKRNTARSE